MADWTTRMLLQRQQDLSPKRRSTRGARRIGLRRALLYALFYALLLALLTACSVPTTPAPADEATTIPTSSEAIATAPAAAAAAATTAAAPPTAGTIPPPADLPNLDATVAQIFTDSLPAPLVAEGSATLGIHNVHVLALVLPPGAARGWVAHTVGLRDFSAEQAHMVALYRETSPGMVAEAARIVLDESAYTDEFAGGPDFLGAGSVEQVQVELADVWLSVEGGVGAHSGVFNLLRYDESAGSLAVELTAFNASPGAASHEDLDGDGLEEIIVNATDPYVFCYACGVRLPDFVIWRWTGNALEQVTLAPLPDDAPAAVRAQTERLIALAEAGLWLDVTRTLAESDAQDVSALAPEALRIYQWNRLHLRLVADARHAAAQPENAPYPLLGHVFNGDYARAVGMMRALPPEELFSTTGPLIAGTVAEGWVETLASWIERSTVATLDIAPEYAPDLAPVWFVRGWGDFLLGDLTDAIANIRQAAMLAPDDALYAGALAWLEADAGSAGARLRALSPVEVRTGPGASYAIQATLQPGESVTITGRFEDNAALWWQVVTVNDTAEQASGRGWVRDDASRVLVANSDHVPMVAAPALVAPVAQHGRILYSAPDASGMAAIYEIGVVADPGPVLVLSEARLPALRPQGDIVAFSSERADMLGLGGLEVRSGERTRYTFHVEDTLPRWNAAGDQILFSSTREGDRRPRIYRSWADSSDYAEELRLGQDADWYSGDERILFKGCDDSGDACGIWMMNGDGTGAFAVTDNAGDARPRWSPDGQSALFMSDQRDGNWEVYLVDLRGVAGQPPGTAPVLRLTEHPDLDGLPVFSPDGASAAFISNRNGEWAILSLPVSGGEATRILGLGSHYPDWLEQGLEWVR